MDNFNVLTEEVPNIDEIKIMFKMIGKHIPDVITNKDIKPNIITDCKGKKFKGDWYIQYENCKINILLFKGETSCVDYMLFNGNVDLTTGNAENALVILESTKTSDDASRNTAVYQRITKFTTFDTIYPNFNGIKVMFWCNSNWKETLTPTANYGFRLMVTLGINMYALNNNSIINVKDKYSIEPYNSDQEIIENKNCIKEKKGNCSIRLSKTDNNIYISLKLDKGKGNSSGVISHDPNVGFLSAVINSIEKITGKPNNNKYIIKNHNIKQEYFDNKPKSKFWYSIKDVNIEFENCTIINRPDIPNKYFKLENSMTEKLATILYDQISLNETIFSNHGGCELTSIKGNDTSISVGQKMPRPDILFKNDETKEILIIEGKLEKEISKGITQLSDTHLQGFIKQIEKLYPDYTIKKGLCITISNIDCINQYSNIEFPVKFALDSNGYFINL